MFGCIVMDICFYINVYSIFLDKFYCSLFYKFLLGILMKIKLYVYVVRFNYINLYFGNC